MQQCLKAYEPSSGSMFLHYVLKASTETAPCFSMGTVPLPLDLSDPEGIKRGSNPRIKIFQVTSLLEKATFELLNFEGGAKGGGKKGKKGKKKK